MLVTEADRALLHHLREKRLSTRFMLIELLDLIAYKHAWLMEAATAYADHCIKSGRVDDPFLTRLRGVDFVAAMKVTPKELEERKRAARRLGYKQLRKLIRLGMIEANRQRRSVGDDADRALRALGGEEGKQGSTGALAEVLHLSKDGLRLVLADLDGEYVNAPTTRDLETAHVRVAHSLGAAHLYICLQALEAAGLVDVIEFTPEKHWSSELELAKKETKNAHGALPRTDVYVRLSQPGDEVTSSEALIEVDRGHQRANQPSPMQKRSKFLLNKLDDYYWLGSQLAGTRAPSGSARERLDCYWVVPEHARTGVESRATKLADVCKQAKEAARVKHPKGAGFVRWHVAPPKPTEEWVAWLLAIQAHANDSDVTTGRVGAAGSSRRDA